MLGSYFDLKREIARIAAKRAAAEAKTDADGEGGAYSDFDSRLQDFVRSFDPATHAAEQKAQAPSGQTGPN